MRVAKRENRNGNSEWTQDIRMFLKSEIDGIEFLDRDIQRLDS